MSLLIPSAQATLTVTAALDQCAKATAVELWRRSDAPIPHADDQPVESLGRIIPRLGRGAIQTFFTRIERRPVGTECRWTFDGLPEGDYVARLVRTNGSGGSRSVKVVTGSAATIDMPAPTVTLSGTVTLDGQPHAGEVHIRDQAWTGPAVVVSADPAGHYTATLDRPANYVIRVETSSRGVTARGAQLHDGVNELDLRVRTVTVSPNDLGIASLTATARDLPDGCRLRPYIAPVQTAPQPPPADGTVTIAATDPESLPGNPWVGFNRQALIKLLWTTPVPDAPPPPLRGTRAMESALLLHVREGYRAVYDSSDGSTVEVRGVRFDDVKEMPTMLAAPRQTYRDQLAIGTILVQIAAPRETDCSRAIETYLRALQ